MKTVENLNFQKLTNQEINCIKGGNDDRVGIVGDVHGGGCTPELPIGRPFGYPTNEELQDIIFGG